MQQLSLLDQDEKPDGVPMDTLQILLSYSPDTGELVWKERPASYFSDGFFSQYSQANQWNAKFANKTAFTSVDTGGYKHGRILGRLYRAHRVAWALHFGEWPSAFIDHINGVRDDNRIVNLRVVSMLENNRNCGVRLDNKSGTTGVGFHKRLGKWFANLRVEGRLLHLGYFVNIEDAVHARRAADLVYGFHENHGNRASHCGSDISPVFEIRDHYKRAA